MMRSPLKSSASESFKDCERYICVLACAHEFLAPDYTAYHRLVTHGRRH